jgi:hypothetical protein
VQVLEGAGAGACADERIEPAAGGVHLGAVTALPLGVRGDGADFLDGFAEAAVVEFLGAGGVAYLDEAADLVGSRCGLPGLLDVKERGCIYPGRHSCSGKAKGKT